jgi:hypothetical protein
MSTSDRSEDACVANVLNVNGIHPHHDPRYTYGRYEDRLSLTDILPTREDEIIKVG